MAEHNVDRPRTPAERTSSTAQDWTTASADLTNGNLRLFGTLLIYFRSRQAFSSHGHSFRRSATDSAHSAQPALSDPDTSPNQPNPIRESLDPPDTRGNLRHGVTDPLAAPRPTPLRRAV